MGNPERTAIRAHEDLIALGVDCALVGGLAVGFHSGPRTTKDADFAVAVTSDADADRVVFGMRHRGYVPVDVILHSDSRRVAMVRLRAPRAEGAEPELDLLFATTGIEPEIVESAKPVEVLPGAYLRTAQRGHLLAAKLVSYDDDRRPQDRIDIMALLKRATPADIKIARGAVKLITERGYNRGRDLAKDLERFVEIVKKIRA